MKQMDWKLISYWNVGLTIVLIIFSNNQEAHYAFFIAFCAAAVHDIIKAIEAKNV